MFGVQMKSMIDLIAILKVFLGGKMPIGMLGLTSTK